MFGSRTLQAILSANTVFLAKCQAFEALRSFAWLCSCPLGFILLPAQNVGPGVCCRSDNFIRRGLWEIRLTKHLLATNSSSPAEF